MSTREGQIIWDIETRPADNAADMVGEFTAPSTWKDPVKIAASIAEQRAKAIEQAALSPFAGAVLAIGCLNPESGVMDVFHGLDEKRVLTEFWQFYASTRTAGHFHDWIGWNSNSFDLPMVVRRSWAHGLKVPRLLTERGYPCDWFIDLRTAWGFGDKRAEGKLGEVAKLFGLGDKAGNGADFAKLYATDLTAALDYLTIDLRLTVGIADRLL